MRSPLSCCLSLVWLALFFNSVRCTLVDLVVATPDLSTLETAVVAAGLVDALSSPGPFTVFAPLDAAFGDLGAAAPILVTALLNDPGFILHLQDVLLFHVVEGSEIFSGDIPSGTTSVSMLNGEMTEVVNSGGSITIGPALGGTATVVLPDLAESNGVAHAIDAVLLPSFVSTSIVDVAISLAPEFTTLVNLVVLAGLDGTLATQFGLTVFAPTNDAFAMLDAATVNYLTSPGGADDLVATLAYHVVPTVIPSTAIPAGRTLVPTLLDGTQLIVMGYPNSVWVNKAKVIVTDVLANNGIIHAIDKVLIPPFLRPNVFKGKGKGKGYWKGKGKGKGYWKGKGKGYWYGMGMSGKGMSKSKSKSKGMMMRTRK